MPAWIWTFIENLAANWTAELFGPKTVIAWFITLAIVIYCVVAWHVRQRAAKKPGMASFYFIIPCLVIGIIAIAAAAYGIGLRGMMTSSTAAAGSEQTEMDLYTGKQVAVASPYPQSILTSRYYSKKNKEDIADILDKTADALNKKGNDLLLMAETAINKSPWDRPGEDLAPMIDRLAYIEAMTTDFRRDLFELLFRDYPDYRIELNNLIFPAAPPANFGGGAKNFQNALIVWREHRDSLDGSQRQEFVTLVGTARSAFAGSREEFLKWATERETKITQTRMALKQ